MEEPQRDDGLLMDEPDMGEAPAEQPPMAPDAFVQWVTTSRNLAEELDEQELKRIARQALDDYQMDKDSMSDWFTQMDKGLKLAQLVKGKKDWPFENASNVKYPLITSAALQFNARAYPAIVPEDRVVKAKVWGDDPQGMKAARGERVSEFMSWQLGGPIIEWEEETDKLLTILPIVGTMVRKWWRCPIENRAKCRLIDPGKFIVNDKVQSLESAPRCTEELPLYPVEIESRVRSGQFVPFDYTKDPEDKHAAQDFIEQHTRLDLDADGYDEPYVAIVHVETQTVVRLVADFAPEDVAMEFETRQVETMAQTVDPYTGMAMMVPQIVEEEYPVAIVSIKRGSYFVSYKFLPGMGGGWHGTGLGLLLGDISEAINTIINTLLDAGHYASLGGGFIGSELRMKGGAQRMRPGEWKMVQSAGQDVRSAVVPMTWPGPDATLFQLLGLLIDAGREIASVKDVITGDAPRQQTATTTLAMIEQGMMVFTAAYKRIFRSLKTEYKLLARINAETITPEEYNQFHDGQEQFDPRADFGAADMDVEPVADPRSVTKMQEAGKAQMIMQLAEQGLVDRAEALKRVAQATDIPDVELLVPKPDPMQAKMQEMQMAGVEAQLMQAKADIELTLAKIESERAGVVKDLSDVQAKEIGLRLDAMRMMMEDRRARLDSLLGGAERMARASGNGGAARGNGQGAGQPARGPQDQMAALGFGAGPGPLGPVGGGAMG